MFPRDLRLFLRSLKTILLLGICLGLVSAGAVYGYGRTEQAGSTVARVVVCNQDTESTYGDLLLEYAAQYELITALVSIDFCDTEEEAVQAVEDGAAAAVIIPEGFFTGVEHGDPPVCELMLSADGQSARRLVETYLKVASDLLVRGQQMVYAGDYYMDDLGVDKDTADAFNLHMNLRFFMELADAQEIYLEETTIAYTDSGLGSTVHYLALYLMFLLGVLALGYDALYQTDLKRARLSMLAAAGIRPWRFLLWKALLPFGLSVLITGAVCVIAGQSVVLTVTPVSVLMVLFGLLCLSLWSALFACGLGRTSGIVIFSVQMLGLLLNGGIIPYVRLKPVVLEIGAWTPLGLLYRLMTPLCGGMADASVWIGVLVYTLLGVAVYLGHLKQLMLGREGV